MSFPANVSEHKSGVHMYFDMMNDYEIKSYYPIQWNKFNHPRTEFAEKVQMVALFAIKGVALTFASMIGVTIFTILGSLKNASLIIKDIAYTTRAMRHPDTAIQSVDLVQNCISRVLSKMALISMDFTSFIWGYELSIAYGFFPSQIESCFNKVEGYSNFSRGA